MGFQGCPLIRLKAPGGTVLGFGRPQPNPPEGPPEANPPGGAPRKGRRRQRRSMSRQYWGSRGIHPPGPAEGRRRRQYVRLSFGGRHDRRSGEGVQGSGENPRLDRRSGGLGASPHRGPRPKGEIRAGKGLPGWEGSPGRASGGKRFGEPAGGLGVPPSELSAGAAGGLQKIKKKEGGLGESPPEKGVWGTAPAYKIEKALPA